MTKGYGGLVDKHGRSALPQGVVDHAEGADDVIVTEEVQRRLDGLFKDGYTDRIKAKYKLEVVFNEERSMVKPYWGLLTAWTNEGFMHGGGDEAVYFCSSVVEKDGQKRTCSAPLNLKWIGAEAAVCPHCRSAVHPRDLAGQVGFRTTTQHWAGIITRTWLRLGADADIRIGVMRGNLHNVTSDVLNKSNKAIDKLDELRADKREWAIYPLHNILKDTAAGADLEARIRHFISS